MKAYDKDQQCILQEVKDKYLSYNVKQDPQRTDPLGNPYLENYRRYHVSAEMERRCCFCGRKIPEGPVRQIPHKDYTSIYGGYLPYWRYCNSCRKISETRIEDLKRFPACHPEAYVFLCREYEAERERIQKKEKMEKDLLLKSQAKEEEKKRKETERKQDILRRMEPFLKKHGGTPASAEMILSFAKEAYHLDYEYYLTKLKANEDCIVIYEDGGACSFFDDGGGERWHKQWEIRYVGVDAVPEEDRDRIKEADPEGTIQKTPWGKYYRNPFGLSGVFAAGYFVDHEDID